MTKEHVMPSTVEDRLAAVELRLRTLEDIEEIRTLRMRYHEMHNERRSGDIAELFAADGELDLNFMGSTLANLLTSTQRNELMKQMVHSHVVEVTGDSATGFAYLDGRAVFHGRAFVYGGRYDDRYVRTPAGWRFLSMRFEPFMFLPFDQSWADPARRKIDPHAGYLKRDAAHNVIGDLADSRDQDSGSRAGR
jgi:hypothetical protein